MINWVMCIINREFNFEMSESTLQDNSVIKYLDHDVKKKLTSLKLPVETLLTNYFNLKNAYK